MNLGGGQNTEGSNAGGIFVQFNQDCTSLVAGSSSGYHLFALTPDDGVEEIYASRSGQDTCLVDRLFSSSLVAVVTLAAPRKLIVCHYKKGTEICNYSYSNTILAVKLNRSRLVVCLEESLHIHNIRDMKILHTIRDTPPNPRGLCALAPCADRCLLAYPGSATAGEVQIFDAVHLNALCVVGAHDAPLAALAWSACGRRLATASERGTVLRVYGVPERARLYELRRGVKRCVTISCLAFSACGHYLAAASNTETVHVFRLAEGEGGEVAAPPGGEEGGEAEAEGGAGAGAGRAGCRRRWRRARVCCRRTWARCWRRVARSPPRACPSPGPGSSLQSPPRRRGPRGCWWRRRRACCTCTAWTRPRAVTARCCARTTCSAPDRTPRPPGTPRRPAATTRAR